MISGSALPGRGLPIHCLLTASVQGRAAGLTWMFNRCHCALRLGTKRVDVELVRRVQRLGWALIIARRCMSSIADGGTGCRGLRRSLRLVIGMLRAPVVSQSSSLGSFPVCQALSRRGAPRSPLQNFARGKACTAQAAPPRAPRICRQSEHWRVGWGCCEDKMSRSEERLEVVRDPKCRCCAVPWRINTHPRM